VMIYPEGTRSRTGEIMEFKNGAFTLAVEENCPVYPIVITGTADALARHGALFGLRASICARVLDPVYPESVERFGVEARARDRAAALRDKVREIMVRELARLRAEQKALVPQQA